MLDTTKFDNCNKCRIELGTVGGTAVSNISGNLVDLENDLRGQTRPASLCSVQQYNNPCAGKADNCQPDRIYVDGLRNDTTSIDARKKHLAPCQMVRYRPIPIAPPVRLHGCPVTQSESQAPQAYNHFS